MNTLDFVKTINKLRLANKNKWIYWEGLVNNKTIQLKSFNTYLQVLKSNNIDFGGTMEINVSEFKSTLIRAVEYKQ